MAITDIENGSSEDELTRKFGRVLGVDGVTRAADREDSALITEIGKGVEAGEDQVSAYFREEMAEFIRRVATQPGFAKKALEELAGPNYTQRVAADLELQSYST